MMSMKFIRGMAAGTLFGMAAGIMFVPSMSRTTRRKIRRANKYMLGTAEDIVGSMKDMVER